jgi:hypothetical protein
VRGPCHGVWRCSCPGSQADCLWPVYNRTTLNHPLRSSHRITRETPQSPHLFHRTSAS